jgi:hypothetical protein
VRRAVAILALWVLYTAVPVVVGFQRADPLACCRLKGAHACALRTRGATTLAARASACATVAAKGITRQAAVLFTPAAFATSSPSHVVASAVMTRRSVAPRTLRSPRAPPAALV